MATTNSREIITGGSAVFGVTYCRALGRKEAVQLRIDVEERVMVAIKRGGAKRYFPLGSVQAGAAQGAAMKFVVVIKYTNGKRSKKSGQTIKQDIASNQ